MSKEVQFNKEVARATFNEKTRTDRCLKSRSNATLVDEEEIASRSSEFQNVSRIGEAAWQRQMELVTESDYKAVVHDAIKSVDQDNITAEPARYRASGAS